MGFRISLLAARADKGIVLSRLGLTDTGKADEANETPLSAGELPNGWTIIWSSDCDWAGVERLDGLTPRPPVMSLMVHEGVMACRLVVADDTARWSVGYGDEREGELTGDWPASLAPIVAQARDRASKDDDGEVDYLFEVPVLMMEAITGYRYDGAGDVTFTAVEGGAPMQRRAWWKFF